jgi:uncharacterized protein YjfI (DUF2170 family)
VSRENRTGEETVKVTAMMPLPSFGQLSRTKKNLLMRKREFGELSNRNYLIRIVGALQSILYNILVVLQ